MERCYWEPRVELDRREEKLMSRLVRIRKLYAFLRRHRHEIVSREFQDELLESFRSNGAGKPPVAPGLLAMAVLLQGYAGVSDADASELSCADARWQMVLGTLGSEEPAFSQATLQGFRERLIRANLDLRLLERTVELAERTGEYDRKKLPKSLRVAVDSSPFEGAGRVEDALNLLGHAARKLIQAAAKVTGRSSAQVRAEAELEILSATSVKRGLDRQWHEPGATRGALEEVVGELGALVRWCEKHIPEDGRKSIDGLLSTIDTVREQNIETIIDNDGMSTMQIRVGVAPDRRISIEDSEMRHGRKSSSKRFNGYKRHVMRDLDSGLIVACSLTPANQPEALAMSSLEQDLRGQGKEIGQLYIDMGYVSAEVVHKLERLNRPVVCRPFPTKAVNNVYEKTDFDIDLSASKVTCPNGVSVPIRSLGRVVQFPAQACRACSKRSQCTTSKGQAGRQIRISEHEPQQQRLRREASTPDGRARLRQRVAVEHTLAHLSQRQGRRARYFGTRKNLFDLRRACAIQNLETIQRTMVSDNYRMVA